MKTREAVTEQLQAAMACASFMRSKGDNANAEAVRHLAEAIRVLLAAVEQLAGDDK